MQIPDLHISNFKCFESLSLEGAERINLVGGKNNVGKSALLEALELLANGTAPDRAMFSLAGILRRRQQRVDFELACDVFRDDSAPLEIGSGARAVTMDLEQDSIAGQKIRIKTDPQQAHREFAFNDFRKTFPNRLHLPGRKDNVIVFLTPGKLHEGGIADYYGHVVEHGWEGELDQSLAAFDPHIEALKAIPSERGTTFKVKRKDHRELFLLSSLGAGTTRLVTMLSAIWAAKDGLLLIDEIENGIHFMQLPLLWRLLFETSKMAGCQVFATTHGRECIETFSAANATFRRGAYFELAVDAKRGGIFCTKHDADVLAYSLDTGLGVRGE